MEICQNLIVRSTMMRFQVSAIESTIIFRFMMIFGFTIFRLIMYSLVYDEEISTRGSTIYLQVHNVIH